MKRIFIVFLIFLSVVGCNNLTHDKNGDVIDVFSNKENNAAIFKYYNFSFLPKCNSVKECTEWVSENITYKHDIPGQDHWQTPEETLYTFTNGQRTGDCEDYAILLIFMLKFNLNIDAKLVTTKIINKDGYFNSVKDDYHAMTLIDSNIIDGETQVVWPINSKIFKQTYSIIDIYNFNELLDILYNQEVH